MGKNIKDVWNFSPISKRKKLAKELGYKAEWGKLKYGELSKRGNPFLKHDLEKLWKNYKLKK